MDFGTGILEVVGIHFSQRHRAFDSLGLGQVLGFSFGELKRGPTCATSLRVTVAPTPVFDEFPRAFHGLVFDRAGSDLRPEDKDSATFLAIERSRRLAVRVDFGYHGSPSWKRQPNRPTPTFWEN